MNSRIWSLILGLLLGGHLTLEAALVCRARLSGPIGPATLVYFSRAIQETARQGAECLVIELDTPGGLLDTTKEIIQKFYEAPIPVVVYVAPAGANAGSAGCFITLAADIAAMAPHTSIGAAHPVALGGGTGQEGKLDDIMKQKLENFAASYIEAIANKRNRNVEWAKSSVRDSASITAEKALELKVIEIIAPDFTDLLRQLDGRTAQNKVLRTQGANVVELPMALREHIFQSLWRPETMFLLMLIAMYGLLGELSHPGAMLPGIAGAIALVLALYMAAIVPINFAGLALILLAVAIFVIDIFAPTHGILTAGGIVAFFIGSLMLFDRSDPAFRLSLSLIVPATVITAAFFLWILGAGLRAQFLSVKTGRETMLGKTVTAESDISATDGRVWIEGESWRAVSETPILSGSPVQVVEINGLTLTVKPAKTSA